MTEIKLRYDKQKEYEIFKGERLPDPLCKPVRHPVKFMKNRLQMLVGSALFTYIGVLIVAAIYYILVESNSVTHDWWHELVPNSELRHNIRDTGEGLLGGLLGHMIIWNHFKKSIRKKANFLDKLEWKLRIPNVKDSREISLGQLLTIIPIVIIYGAPGFFIGELIVHHIHFGEVYTTSKTGLGTSVIHNITENLPQKIIGYMMAFFFARRPAKAVFDDLQLWLVERKHATDKEPHWFDMPTFKARFHFFEIQKNRLGIKPQLPRTIEVVTIRSMIVAAVPLAVFGFYVLNFIARGKYL